MSNYRKGRSAENYVKGKLSRMGFTVFRIASSKPADLLAVDATRMFIVEVKNHHLSQNALHKEADRLWELCKDTPLRPLVIHKDGNKKYQFVEFKEKSRKDE